jgi:acyl-coenzyme A thioesterase PaaI-like protein
LPLVHHELCFGCGRTNLFGLLLEAEHSGSDAVAGRCFVKQDHQGARHGTAHEGIPATALIEAMALACGRNVRLERLELNLGRDVPVGEFLEVEASVHDRGADELHVAARVKTGADYVGSASGSFRVWPTA